jgi:hypothetical protein
VLQLRQKKQKKTERKEKRTEKRKKEKKQNLPLEQPWTAAVGYKYLPRGQSNVTTAAVGWAGQS